MGADVFHVCFGVRQEIPATETDTITALEKRQHPWQVAAKKHKLQSWWGVTTEEDVYFLLVGHIVGHFGWEEEERRELTHPELLKIVAETIPKLTAAGIAEAPAWYFEFEPD